MLRKIISVLLAVLTLFFTALSLLGIWDLIKVEHIFRNSLYSIFTLFASAAILLFIFSVLYKEERDNIPPPSN